MPGAPTVDGGVLRWDGRSVDVRDVRGFAERYDRWTGRAWLIVRGPGWRVPIGDGYAEARAALRAALPGVPFTSDWARGRFPSAPGGLPPDLAFVGGATVAGLLAAGVAARMDAAAGVAVALAALWPLARLRDAVVITRDGLRAGPPWAASAPWHEVESVRAELRGRQARISVRSRSGGGFATVPAVLLPALRARLWRLGGVRLVVGPAGLDEVYDRWRAPATGIPWGILVGTAAIAWAVPAPWTALTAGLLAMAGTALLGAAVEARATGWGSGAVLWSTGAYGVVLAALALGLGGWLGGG